MSELGITSFSNKNNEIDYNLYGEEIGKKAKQIILDELRTAEIEAKTILRGNKNLLDVVAQEIFQRKELSGEELDQIIERYKKN